MKSGKGWEERKYFNALLSLCLQNSNIEHLLPDSSGNKG